MSNIDSGTVNGMTRPRPQEKNSHDQPESPDDARTLDLSRTHFIHWLDGCVTLVALAGGETVAGGGQARRVCRMFGAATLRQNDKIPVSVALAAPQ